MLPFVVNRRFCCYLLVVGRHVTLLVGCYLLVVGWLFLVDVVSVSSYCDLLLMVVVAAVVDGCCDLLLMVLFVVVAAVYYAAHGTGSKE